MGPLLDLVVLALAVAVIVSLLLLAWSLGVSGVAAVRRGHAATTGARARLAREEARLRGTARRLDTTIADLANRTRR